MKLYLEQDVPNPPFSDGMAYGGYVIQQDYWKSQDGEMWMGRNGEPPKELRNPKYLYTRFCTGSNETLIPFYSKTEKKS